MIISMSDSHTPLKIGAMASIIIIRISTFFLCACLLVFSHVGWAKTKEKPSELLLLTWSEYIAPKIVKEFERKHNAKITMVYFESNDHRTELLLESNGATYDLVLTSGEMLEPYTAQGWLAPLTSNNIPNLIHIDERWIQSIKGDTLYGAPYFWGTLGIAYRKDLVSKPINSWKHLFAPDKSLQGKILMARGVNDLVGMALKSLGYSANSSSEAEHIEAEKLLKSQKNYVREYGYTNLTEQSGLVTGELLAAMAYSGDALSLQAIHPEIEYVLPKEGGNIWIDYLSVSAASKKKALAYAFINFINQPNIAARQAKYLNYATPNKSAEKLLDKRFLNNTIIYPDEKALAKSEYWLTLKTKTQLKRDIIVSRLLQH